MAVNWKKVLLSGGAYADLADSSKIGAGSTQVAQGNHNHSSAYLGLTAKASDSNLLDGVDSSRFHQMSAEYSNSATSGSWYTIATASTARGFGHFFVWNNTSGIHGIAEIVATTSYGQNSITKLHGDTYSGDSLKYFRILYYTADKTYGGAKLQVYIGNNCTLKHKMLYDGQIDGWNSWTPITPVNEGTPAGWTEDSGSRINNVSGNGPSAYHFYSTSTIYEFGASLASRYKAIGYVPAWSEITSKPSTFAPSSHTHNNADWSGADLEIVNGGTGASSVSSARTNLGVYSTGEVDTLLAGYSATTHTHDTRYYTELEVDDALDLKFNKTGGTVTGNTVISADGAVNVYRGVLRIGNTAGGQWGGIAFPDSTGGADVASNNYWFIGRGGSIASRVLSFHIPTLTNYGSGITPRFVFASTGADELLTIESTTGNTWVKGNLTLTTGAITWSGGGSANANTAYTHSQVAHAPSDANNYSHPANHAISVITGLQTALDGKSATHSHPYMSNSMSTDFTGTYPIVVNVSNTLYSNAGMTYTGATDTMNLVNLAVSGTVDGRNIATDGIKLDGIATSANNYTLDKAKVEAVLTGEINSHYHDHIWSYDARAVNRLPNSLDRGVWAEFKTNTTDGLADGGTYHGILHWKSYGGAGDNSGGYPMQLAYTSNGNLWARFGATTSTWNSWKKLSWDHSHPYISTSHQANNITAQIITNANQGAAHAGSAHAPSGAQAHIAPTKAEVEAVLTGAITSHSHTDANTWRGVDDTPVNGQTAESISSNWAYDHNASGSVHGATDSSTVSTIVKRNSSGDINARLFRSEYDTLALSANINHIMVQHDSVSDNYIRPASPATIRTVLNVADGANNYVHPTNHAISVITGLQTALDGKTTEAWVTAYAYDKQSTDDLLNAKLDSSHAVTHPAPTNRDTRNQIAGTYNNYVHPTTAGNKHIPTGGSGGQYLTYSASGTAQWSNMHSHPYLSSAHDASAVTSALITSWNAKADAHSHPYLSSTHDASNVTSVLRGQWGTGYTHSQSAHAPSGAQAHIAPTKVEVEAVLTGAITSHTHAYASDTHNHASTYLGLLANAYSASKLVTARTITLTGDVTGSVSFNGTANVSITTVVGNDSHTHAYANLTGKPSIATTPDDLNWDEPMADVGAIGVFIGADTQGGDFTSRTSTEVKGDLGINDKLDSADAEAGWHGSTTRIKILPQDFQPNDDQSYYNVASIDNGGRIKVMTASLEAYVSIPIPTGYKATHVCLFGSDSVNPVAVYESMINKSTSTSKGTGTVNSEINITDVTATATNYLVIRWAPIATSDYLYGGYVTIAKV